jgi:type III pantothenate kinase
MKYLTGDIGNTLTKITLFNEKFKIIKSSNIETYKLKKINFCNKFFKNFINSTVNKTILFSSVVPSAYILISSFLKKKQYKVIEVKELNIKKIIKLKVNSINQLGSDRIANAIGAFSRYKENCLVVDFGTATTFDIIKKPGIYDGGVIAPGIKLSIVNLNKSTALLPILKLKSVAKKYGKNTKDALNAGFLWGYQGLINNIIKKITTLSKTKYKVILTGGYAKFFKKFVNNNPIIDENITIRGIIEIYKKLLI